MTATRISVDVTENDIRRAMVSDSYKCVVAQAIARTIPDATKIEVDIQTIRFTRQTTGSRYVYLTPYTVQGYVVAFDAGDNIEPFRFQLRNPQTIKRKKPAPPSEPIRSETVEAEKPIAVPINRDELPTVTVQEPVATDPLDIDPNRSYQQVTNEVKNSTTRVPPTTYKTKSRSYGLRILRYNQTPAVKEEGS